MCSILILTSTLLMLKKSARELELAELCDIVVDEADDDSEVVEHLDP